MLLQRKAGPLLAFLRFLPSCTRRSPYRLPPSHHHQQENPTRRGKTKDILLPTYQAYSRAPKHRNSATKSDDFAPCSFPPGPSAVLLIVCLSTCVSVDLLTCLLAAFSCFCIGSRGTLLCSARGAGAWGRACVWVRVWAMARVRDTYFIQSTIPLSLQPTTRSRSVYSSIHTYTRASKHINPKRKTKKFFPSSTKSVNCTVPSI